MFHYHMWANKKMFHYFQDKAVEKLFFKEVQSVFPSISGVIDHIYMVDHLWFNRMKGRENAEFAEVHFASVKEADQKIGVLHEEMAAFLARTNTNQLINYQNSKGELFTNTIDELVIHIANHGTYHRGNVTAILRQLGKEGISTDYIHFLREKANLRE